MKRYLLLLQALFFTSFLIGQTTIWSEDFSSYVDDTGIDGTGNIGDYPANVTKWTLDVSSCSLSNQYDYIKTDNERLKTQDVDGDAIWQSESIDISAYANGVEFSIKFYEYDNMEDDDYIDVYYQIDGGAFTLIQNWNGHGSSTHTLTGNFSKDTVVQTINSGSSMVIKVAQNCDSGAEELQMDDVFVYANMVYDSSTTTQVTKNIGKGRINREIIGIEIETSHSANPLTVSSFTVNANGSTTPVSDNINNAKIFYTGTSDEFSDSLQFGNTYTTPTTTNFNITGSQQLQSGTNYFWLTFDTKTTASTGDVIDAECISFILDGNTENPVTSAPAGNRSIADPLNGNYSIGAAGNYTNMGSAVDDLNELGISGNTIFNIDSANYTEQLKIDSIYGTSSTDSVIFQSDSSNRQDVIIQYSPTANKNFVVKLNGTDYLTFNNLSFTATGTGAYGRVLDVEGHTSNLNFTNCNFTGLTTTSGSNDLTVINFDSGTDNMANNILFDDDSIKSGSYGLYFGGADTSNLETGNIIQNCFFEEFYYTGLEITYQDAIHIENNKFKSSVSGSEKKGITGNYCNNASNINRNRILLNATNQVTGLALTSCFAGTGTEGLISNNFISLEQASIETIGLDLVNSCHQHIIHNTINIYSTTKNGQNRSGQQSGLVITHYWQDVLFGFIKIINNIISSNAKALVFSQNTADNGYVSESNHNDLHSTGSVLGSYGSTDCSDLGQWQTASGQDANSVSEDPQFESNSQPFIHNQNLDESVPQSSEVQIDINDDLRENVTAPGAVKGILKVWTGTNSSDWSDPNNWSPVGVPASNDRVLILDGAYYNPKLYNNVQINELTINGRGGTAELHLNGHTLDVSGDFNCNDGLVTNGTIELNGGSNQNLKTDSESQNAQYWNVKINKSDPDTEVKLRDDLPVNNLDVQNGELNANNKKIEINGNANFSGGTVSNTSEVEFTSSQIVDFNPGSNTLGNLNFSGGGTYNQLAKLICQGNFTVNGTYNSNNNDIDFPVPSVADLKNAAANSHYHKVTFNATPSKIRLGILQTFTRLVAACSGRSTTELTVEGNLNVDTLNIGIEGEAGNSILKILPSSSVEVNDEISIATNGNITLQSSDTTTASLINHVDVSGSGNIKIERYLVAEQWHLLSAPVNGATANNLYFNGNPDVWLKEYNESTDNWTYLTSLSEPLTTGKGFATWVENTNVTANFEGSIRSNNLTLDNSTAPALEFTDSNHGYNLVGNPFASAIDWDEGSWTRTNIEGSVWVWQDAGNGDGSGNYLTRNLAGEGSLTDGIIPINQGFFIRATSATPSLIIPKDARVISGQQYYKSTYANKAPHVVLSVEGDNKKDEVWIGFDEDASFGIDYGRDATKNFGNNSPQLWLVEEETDLSIDILPELEDNKPTTVQMNFDANSTTAYEIKLAKTTLTDVIIILEDRKEGIFHDLTQNPVYSFFSTSYASPERFFVHFYSITTDTKEIVEADNKDVRIFNYNNQINIIDNDFQNSPKRSVIIYDIQGRKIVGKNLSGSSLNQIGFNKKGSFIVSYINGKEVYNQLIIN